MAPAVIQEKLRSLPPVPTVANDILGVLNDQGACLQQIAKALSKEPGLTARIVALANSAFFARQSPVYSVDEAVVRLGMQRIRVLASSILLSSQFDTRRCPAFDAARYWYDAVGAAFASHRLAPFVPVEVPSDATYLAGLLHNFGMLLLACAFPDEYDQTLRRFQARDNTDSLSELEQDALGFDHHYAGGLLLEQWGLPRAIYHTAYHIHDRDYAGPFSRLVKLVRVSADWTRHEYLTTTPSVELRGVSERTLTAIANTCRSETEQLRGFANLLASQSR